MKIISCTIGEISHLSEEDLFVGEVVFVSRVMNGFRRYGKHPATTWLLILKIKGDKSWCFQPIQSEFLKETHVLGSHARRHLGGATLDLLNEYTETSFREDRHRMVSSLMSVKPT